MVETYFPELELTVDLKDDQRIVNFGEIVNISDIDDIAKQVYSDFEFMFKDISLDGYINFLRSHYQIVDGECLEFTRRNFFNMTSNDEGYMIETFDKPYKSGTCYIYTKKNKCNMESRSTRCHELSHALHAFEKQDAIKTGLEKYFTQAKNLEMNQYHPETIANLGAILGLANVKDPYHIERIFGMMSSQYTNRGPQNQYVNEALALLEIEPYDVILD